MICAARRAMFPLGMDAKYNDLPDGLWDLIRVWIPPQRRSPKGGQQPVEDRRAMAGIYLSTPDRMPVGRHTLLRTAGSRSPSRRPPFGFKCLVALLARDSSHAVSGVTPLFPLTSSFTRCTGMPRRSARTVC